MATYHDPLQSGGGKMHQEYRRRGEDASLTPSYSEQENQRLLNERYGELAQQRAAQRGLVDSYKSGVQRTQNALVGGDAAIRANAARRLSSSMAGIPMGSGAGLAAAGQTGYDADMAAGQFGMQAAQEMSRAETDYATALYESTLPENRIMTDEEREKQVMDDFYAEIERSAEKHKGMWGVDEEAVYDSMIQEARKEPDPVLREAKIKAIRLWYDQNTFILFRQR